MCVSAGVVLSRPGLVQHALFLFSVHLPVLLLLCVDRTTWCSCWLPDFVLSCLTMGQRTVWTSITPELPGTAVPLALQRQWLPSPSCTHRCMAALGWCSPSHTFKLLINVSLRLWPFSVPQECQRGLRLCTHTNTHTHWKAHSQHVIWTLNKHSWHNSWISVIVKKN